MTCEDINGALLISAILVAVMGLIFWNSPKGCKAISLLFFARGEALVASREAFHATIAANKEM